jgi:chemotaxis protein MotB
MGRTVGVLAFLLAFLQTGCFLVPESKYKATLREREDCQQEVTSLKEANSSLSSKIKDLEGKLETSQTKLANLKVEKTAEIERVSTSYENLVAELKGEIERGEVKVREMEGKLTVDMMAKVLFDLGKAEVKPAGKEVLDRIGPVLNSATDKEIRIEGHTDSLAIHGDLAVKYPTNWELSTARATNVVRYLQEKVGIDPARLVSTGYAWYRPVASNSTEEGRQQNRRIEIILAPISP